MFFALLASLVAAATPLKYSSFEQKPKLVVVIVIDQFRADNLSRYSKRFLPATGRSGEVGGFQYLMSRGAYYPAAKFDVLQNMTCPGHAAILTGSTPSRSGIPINEWFDRAKSKQRYCVEDDQDGVSPRQLQGTTVGDELKNTGASGKVISLALKDRAAILLGGHRADLAFWLGQDGKWMTSKYYTSGLPVWLSKVNEKISATTGKDVSWKTTQFSHPAEIGKFTSLETPYGIEITTDAAIAALQNEKLGMSKSTDLLAVSISSHDIVGHNVGPNAPEMEDLSAHEDRSLARLINAVRKQVPGGLKNVLIVLTADHGVAPRADLMKSNKIDAGFIDQTKLVDQIEDDLSKAFGKRKYITAVESLNFYFTNEALDHVKRLDLENRAKFILAQGAGVAHVFSLTDYLTQNLPTGENARQIQKSYIPGKSGDLVVIPKPFWMETGKPATHMTGYSYDRTVPLILSGPHLRAGVFSEAADLVDLAPTLSFLLGILPPAQSEGRVLSEAIGD